MARTLGQIATMIRRRLGWPSADTFVSTPELFDMIRESQMELNDLLISIHGGDYRLTRTSFNTVAGQEAYSISPTDATFDIDEDISRIRRVSAVFDNISRPMRRWNVETDVIDHNSRTWDAATDITYRFTLFTPAHLGSGLQGIFFHPTPANVVTVELWVSIGVVSLSVTDALNQLGNDEYLVLDSMIKCLEMEETDASTIERKKEALIQRMVTNQSPVDAGQPATIGDMRSSVGYGSWYR